MVQLKQPGHRKKVGMFGGSTLFSINTQDESTIPSLLTQVSSSHEFVNFGVGAHNQTVEMMNFIEQIRKQEFEYVIFYDGVNEVGRMLEKYERGEFGGDFLLHNMGYYHAGFTRNGIENSFHYKTDVNPLKPYAFRLIDHFFPPVSISVCAS